MDADGSNLTNLTSLPGTDNGLSDWSPDGTQIVFTTGRDGDSEVYVMDADGSNPTNLTNNAAIDQFATWSPDGSQIAFTSDRGGDRDGYVMSSSGGGATNFTNNVAEDIVGLTQGWR